MYAYTYIFLKNNDESKHSFERKRIPLMRNKVRPSFIYLFLFIINFNIHVASRVWD